ncbi:MAG: potassium transporter TrkG [Terrimicrobiaceae bacterium]
MARPSRSQTDSQPVSNVLVYRWLLIALLSLAALVSLVSQAGFGLDGGLWLAGMDCTLAAGFIAVWAIELRSAKSWKSALRKRRVEMLLVGGALLTLALVAIFSPAESASLHDPVVTVARLFLLACVVVQGLRLLENVLARGIRPEILLAASFVIIIALATLLLILPGASAKKDAPMTLLDAVFTAASAASVTGLCVRDTGSDLTTFGQLVILSTIQLGGLGIITFVALLTSLSNRSLPVPQMVIFRQMMNAPETGNLRYRVAGIFAVTLLIEAAGAAAIYISIHNTNDVASDFKWAVFHSISAFCNAGFSLESNSLEAFQSNPSINFTIMVLIILGGLGFLVLPELATVGWRRICAILPLSFLRPREVLWPRLSNQTRFSIWITAVLLLIGTVGFWLCERDHVLAESTGFTSFLIASFQSVTARTAGFTTIPVGELANSTLILIVLLMVIGGCPVSTAGGIKTVTFAVLVLSLRALVLGRQKIEAFGRTLPASAVFSALNVLVLYLLSAIVGLFALSLTDPSFPLRDLGFETFSALSTVGLSTGITPHLSDAGKIILCVLMFVGRVGPLAMVLSVFHARHHLDYDFPDEDIVVG